MQNVKHHLIIILHIHRENPHYFSTEPTPEGIFTNLLQEDIKTTGFTHTNSNFKKMMKKNNSQEKNLIFGYIMKDKNQNTPNDFIYHQYHSNN